MTPRSSAKLTLPVGDRDHIQGSPEAAVTLVEYGDYECPHCGHAFPIVEKLRRKFAREMRFVYRNFPLTQVHPHAEMAAEAAEAAGAQNRFWEMHDLLFQHQNALDTPHLAKYAELTGIDVKGFAAQLTEHAFRARVREDFMSGVRSGVNGTPTFFINGWRHDGAFDLESLSEAVAAAAAEVA